MLKIFKQPWPLLAAEIVIFIAMLVFGIDFLIQTDHEKIVSLIKAGSKAVEQQNSDAIEPLISENYLDSFHRNKKSLLRHCRTILPNLPIEKNITRIAKINIDRPNAAAVLTVRVVFDENSSVSDFKKIMFVKVRTDLQRQDDNEWLINRVEILEIDRQPFNWKKLRQISW